MLNELFSGHHLIGCNDLFDVMTYRKIFKSIKILQEELVKARNSIEPWFSGPVRENPKIGLGPWLIRKTDELEKVVSQKDKKIDELEKLVEQMRGELGKEKKTICQLLSDGHAARLGADKKIADLVKSQDKLERIVTQKNKDSMAQDEKIDKLEGILSQKNKESMTKDKKIRELQRNVKIIRELEKDPSDAELDVRAKEGAKKQAEAKARLQKMYDERPMINLMDGESIGDLLVSM
jgi:hypothetical protein